MHHKAHRTGTGDLNHGPVEPADVVAQHQDTALPGDVFKTQDIDIVAAGNNTADDITHQRLRQLINRVDSPGQSRNG